MDNLSIHLAGEVRPAVLARSDLALLTARGNYIWQMAANTGREGFMPLITYEWDAAKEASNVEKHKINFETALVIFDR